MKEQKISRRYARALYDIAKDNKILTEVNDDLIFIDKMVNSSKEFLMFLKSPIISKFKKKEVFVALLKDKIQSITLNFILLLNDKQRESLLLDIIAQYENIYNEEHNIQKIIITTAFEPNEEFKQNIIKKLTDWSGKVINAEFIVDKKIIGGILIRKDNWVYDASISHQLELLKQKLLYGN